MSPAVADDARGRGYRAILLEAMGAPDDVSELRDEQGALAYIARDPEYPGAKRVTLDASCADPRCSAQWRLPPAEARPGFYPEGVPFVPGIACRVVEGTTTFVTWRDDACPRPDDERVVRLRDSMPESLKELGSTLRVAVAEGGEKPDLKSVVSGLKDQLASDDVKAWLAAAGGEDVEERFVEAFEDVVAQLREDGWEDDDGEEQDRSSPPLAMRSARLRRGDRRRVVMLTGTFGLGTLTLVEDAPG